MMPRRHQTIACAKTGSCALSPFSVAYTTSISGRQRMLTELLRMTALDNPDQADSVVKFSPIKTGITVVAKQTTTVDIP